MTPLRWKILGAYLVSKLVFVLILYQLILTGNSWDELIFRYDAEWYITILEKGYLGSYGYHSYSVAFAPLFPILGRIVAFVTGDGRLALILIVQISTLLAVNLIAEQLLKRYSEPQVWKIVLLLLFSPMGFLFSIPYSESLFLMLNGICFYLMESRLWGAAGIISLLPVVRLAGVFTGIPFLQQLWVNRVPWWKALSYILLCGVGLSVWMLSSWWYFDDPFQVLVSHSQWHRGFAPFPLVIFYQIYFFVSHFTGWINLTTVYTWIFIMFPYFVDFILIIFVMGLLLLNFRRLPLVYRYYALAYCLWGTSFPPFHLFKLSGVAPPSLSILRFLAVCFPLYILIVLKYERSFVWAFAISLILYIAYIWLYLSGYYIP